MDKGKERLSITTAVICLPGAAKDLEKTIQAVQRGTSCNAAAMREMGIDRIDFGGLAQVKPLSCCLHWVLDNELDSTVSLVCLALDQQHCWR